jgi:hypothetical protein
VRLNVLLPIFLLLAAGCGKPEGTVLGKAPKGIYNIIAVKAGDLH